MSTGKLALPPGAFIAFRQSGGLRFSTREVTVYLDGRTTWRRVGKFDAAQGATYGVRHLKPDEVAALKDLIEQGHLFGLPTTIGRPSLDGYAYELNARLERQSTSVEFFDGNIPTEMLPLLKQLKLLLSGENS